MNARNKILFLIVAVPSILLVINVSLMSHIVANYSPNAYCVPGVDCSTDSSQNNGESMSTGASELTNYVVRGGGYLLNAHSNMMGFLNKIEMSELQGTDYNALSKSLGQTISELEKSRDTYMVLVEISKETAYNPVFISKLKTFDYFGFMQRSGCNRCTFMDVYWYLAWGDVNGIYAHLLNNIEGLLDDLYRIKGYVDARQFPEISMLWKAGRKFSETYQFGQISAEIFYEISRSLKYE